LVAQFGKIFVHLERHIGNSKKRVDFYVFSPDGNFGVDVFYPSDMFNLNNALNIKLGAYKQFNDKLYYLVANTDITQTDINKVIKK